MISRLKAAEQLEEQQEAERRKAALEKKSATKKKGQKKGAAPEEVKSVEAEEPPKDQEAKPKEEEDIFIPQAEYTAVCNADFAPLICNDFVGEFMDKEHGACIIDRVDIIDLTRNFCAWIAHSGLTCAYIGLF